MAKKRKTKSKASRAKSRLSRLKQGTKKYAKRQSKRPTKQRAKSAKRVVKHKRKTSARRKPTAHHRRTLRKTPIRIQKSKRKPQRSADTKRIERLERELRQTRETLRDVTRTPKERAKKGGSNSGSGREDVSFDIPRGAIVHKDKSGEWFELPPYTGDTFDEIEWGDYDFDDAYELVGDEDEDSYGEDAA
jgi:hypothetical protein